LFQDEGTLAGNGVAADRADRDRHLLRILLAVAGVTKMLATPGSASASAEVGAVPGACACAAPGRVSAAALLSRPMMKADLIPCA
jgi:hypothetical protein